MELNYSMMRSIVRLFRGRSEQCPIGREEVTRVMLNVYFVYDATIADGVNLGRSQQRPVGYVDCLRSNDFVAGFIPASSGSNLRISCGVRDLDRRFRGRSCLEVWRVYGGSDQSAGGNQNVGR